MNFLNAGRFDVRYAGENFLDHDGRGKRPPLLETVGSWYYFRD